MGRKKAESVVVLEATVTGGVTAKTRGKDGQYTGTGKWFPDTEEGRAEAREAAGLGGLVVAAEKYEETERGEPIHEEGDDAAGSDGETGGGEGSDGNGEGEDPAAA